MRKINRATAALIVAGLTLAAFVVGVPAAMARPLGNLDQPSTCTLIDGDHTRYTDPATGQPFASAQACLDYMATPGNQLDYDDAHGFAPLQSISVGTELQLPVQVNGDFYKPGENVGATVTGPTTSQPFEVNSDNYGRIRATVTVPCSYFSDPANPPTVQLGSGTPFTVQDTAGLCS